MKTKPIINYIIVLFAFLLTSCGSDDNVIVEPVAKDPPKEDPIEEPEDETPDPEVTLAAERQTVLDDLTNADEKVWKITEAILTNASGTIDISTNFNVTDDELVFSNVAFQSAKTDFNGTLEWRGGNAIETEGATSEETLLDLYESPFVSAFDFVDDSSTELESPGFTFTYVDQNTITGTATGGDTATIALTLAPKTAADYAQVPSEALNFSQAFTYPSNAIANGAAGMIGSNSSNSIFISNRESSMRGTNDVNPERVSKFNLDTNTLEDKLFFQADFVSKQLHIIDNKLKVVGGQFINTYELNLQSEPESALYEPQIYLSRHGSAVIDDEIYIVGGGLDNPENIGDEIFKWDDLNASLTKIATMPETRSGARAEIIQNKLYIFGGTTGFFGSDSQNAKNTIYIYDFETAAISIETMPVSLNFSYTGKYENLIYVAGQQKAYTDDADGDGNPDGFLTTSDNDPFIGVYNTENGQFTTLETNLTSPEMETIHAMAVTNGKLYVLYGQPEAVAEGEFQNWDVIVADID